MVEQLEDGGQFNMDNSIDFSKFESIGNEIYVYKNFLSEDEVAYFYNIASSMPEDKWHNMNPSINWGYASEHFQELESIRNKMSDVLAVEKETKINNLFNSVFLGETINFIKMVKDGEWGTHSDDHDYKDIISKSENYIEGQPYEAGRSPLFGSIVYFNNFEGGEVYYPNQKIEYHPNAGDLVIHSAKEHCFHGVKKLKSDVRYSYSNYLFKYIKIPKESNLDGN
jgi:hypothetical protein